MAASGDPLVSLSCAPDDLSLGPSASAPSAFAACKVSMLYPTRLETRTKESNMYASQWAH